MNDFVKEVEYLYYHKKLSIRQVANLLDCSASKVKHCLNTELKGARSLKEGCVLRSTTKYKEKLRKTQLGEKNNQVKLTTEAVIKIRQEYEQAINEGAQKTVTQNYLAQKYNVKRPTISDIVLQKTWKHV
ncbi:hypothetical protein NSQ59_27725 [Margalitia sp. FSL K6-0131]|uniref:hypothetical protein n=1 Tax=Margalitia sp. FSL K6-0131 TaxID=2954604 RepID=UPI0030FCA86B